MNGLQGAADVKGGGWIAGAVANGVPVLLALAGGGGRPIHPRQVGGRGHRPTPLRAGDKAAVAALDRP